MSMLAWTIAGMLGAQATPAVGEGAVTQEAPKASPTAPAADRMRRQYVEIYDIRDLLPSYRAGRRSLTEGSAVAKFVSGGADPKGEGAASKPGWDPALEAQRKADDELDAQCRSLLEVMLKCLGAKEEPGLTCDATESGALVLRASSEMHQRVDAAFLALRTGKAPQLQMKAQLFTLDEKGREELAEFCLPKTAGSVDPDRVVLMDPAQVAKFVEQMKPEQSTVPTVITMPLAPFSLMAGNQIAYVAGIDQMVIEGLGMIGDPVVKQLFEGLLIEGVALAMPAAEANGAPYALKLKLTTSAVKRPMAQVKSEIGTVQLPEVRHTEFGTTIAGFTGCPVLVGGFPQPTFDEEAARIYVLVTVTLLPPR